MKVFAIGLWCNGNTSDSGPDIPSSNLGSPTSMNKSLKSVVSLLIPSISTFKEMTPFLVFKVIG